MKTSNSFLDRVLPTYGNSRENIPVYNASQQMFISSTFTSESGNMYYKGIRFSERLIMVEKIGLFHNWTYIDELEIYTFDATKQILIGKKSYNKEFHNADLIKTDAKQMAYDYFKSQIAFMENHSTDEELLAIANSTVEETYENQVEKVLKLSGMAAMLTE